jgi:hypothetical protein
VTEDGTFADRAQSQYPLLPRTVRGARRDGDLADERKKTSQGLLPGIHRPRMECGVSLSSRRPVEQAA